MYCVQFIWRKLYQDLIYLALQSISIGYSNISVLYSYIRIQYWNGLEFRKFLDWKFTFVEYLYIHILCHFNWIRQGLKKYKAIKSHLTLTPPPKKWLKVFWHWDQFLSTLEKKCIFPFENPKTLRKISKKLAIPRKMMALGATSIEKIPKISASGRNFLDPSPPSSKKGPTDENVGISYLIVIIKFGFFWNL